MHSLPQDKDHLYDLYESKIPNRDLSSPYPSPFKLDAHDLGDNRTLKVNVSEPKTRLFIGNIPKSLARNEIESEFRQMSGKEKEQPKNLQDFSVRGAYINDVSSERRRRGLPKFLSEEGR